MIWLFFVVLDDQLEEGSRTENLQAQRCRARLDHLESADTENISEWNNTRLKRILVDYMLRMSYYDTAIKLAQDSNIQVTFWSIASWNCVLLFLLLSGSRNYSLEWEWTYNQFLIGLACFQTFGPDALVSLLESCNLLFHFLNFFMLIMFFNLIIFVSVPGWVIIE